MYNKQRVSSNSLAELEYLDTREVGTYVCARVILESTFPRANVIFTVWTEVMNAHESVHTIWQA